MPGELWVTQGAIRDAVRAAEAVWRGLDPAVPFVPPSDWRWSEFFAVRNVLCDCLQGSLARRELDQFEVRMEIQSIIQYIASLERGGDEWCAYYLPFLPDDVDHRTRPHLLLRSSANPPSANPPH